MKRFPLSLEIARRDWLKTAGLGGSAAILGAHSLHAETPASPAKKVRGIVFMVSDGMSPGVLSLAEAYSKLTRNRGTRWCELINDPKSSRGLMDTASANSMVTDSAAAATAWGAGERVNNGAVNISPSGKELTPIAAILKKKSSANIGLVSTATITHATPAGFAAAVPKRNDEPAIAPQYLNRVDVILGGGSVFFDPKQRPDKRDLSGEFTSNDYDFVQSRDGMLASRSGKILGLFTKGHLPFEIDRENNKATAAHVPSLTEMTRAALSRFLEADKPFLLQVEGARIDHAAHLNDIVGVLGDQIAFDDAVAAVLGMVEGRDDILVVVTSDHGNANPGLNGMGAGYGESNQHFERICRMKSSFERIFGEWGKLKNKDAGGLTDLIQTHLNFKLKTDEAESLLASFNKKPIVEWNHQLDNPEGLLGQITGNHTGIGWTGTTHTSDPTIVSAIGPQSARFSGMVKNTDVFAHLVDILG